jgi:predicted transcriptional regulator
MAIDLKKIKNLFVQNSEDPQTEPAKEANNPINTPSQGETQTIAGSFDSAIFDSLLKAIEDHNLPGEDYLEFLGALKAMEKIPLDEKMKIQTVLATLSTKGLTAQKIKESADYYKKVLQDEQKQFYIELSSQIETQLKSKEKDIADIQKQNTTKSEQIARLTKEINDNQSKIADLQAHIKDAESKIKTAESNFNKTYDYIVSQINTNITKINN